MLLTFNHSMAPTTCLTTTSTWSSMILPFDLDTYFYWLNYSFVLYYIFEMYDIDFCFLTTCWEWLILCKWLMKVDNIIYINITHKYLVIVLANFCRNVATAPRIRWQKDVATLTKVHVWFTWGCRWKWHSDTLGYHISPTVSRNCLV